jgi:hypothetical protein
VWPLPGNRVLLGDELVNKLLAEIMRSIDPQIGQAGHFDGGGTWFQVYRLPPADASTPDAPSLTPVDLHGIAQAWW